MTLNPLVLGEHRVWPPVVLAPMAGVTNQPFRSLCRKFGPGLIYVNEMIMATGLVHGSAKTRTMLRFGPDESFRSLQVYGSDPEMMSRAVHLLGREGAVDHIDINFGCPAPKVTRRGGGAAVPLKKNLLRAIVSGAVEAGAAYGIPITCKFRMGINDDLLTTCPYVTWVYRLFRQSRDSDRRCPNIGRVSGRRICLWDHGLARSIWASNFRYFPKIHQVDSSRQSHNLVSSHGNQH